jgi:hypothetical protein
MGAADHTPNVWTFERTKVKLPGHLPIKVAKGSWAAATDGTLDAGNADTLDIVTVPANCLIVGVAVDVITAETANGTVDIGAAGDDITDDTDLWYDALNIATTGGKPNTGVSGTLFTGGSPVDIRVTATTDVADVDIDGAAFDVYVMYFDLSSFAGVVNDGI